VADPIKNEIGLTTLFEIYPKVVMDNFFLNSPFLAYIRDHCTVPFNGGDYIQNTFLYASMIGGFYSIGDNFNITKPQTLAGAVFDLRHAEFNVTEYKENIQVNNKGPLAVFSLIETDLKNAVLSMSALIAIAMARHGQVAGGGVVDNRSTAINGWSEAINDGLTNSWDGNVFTTYGTATRNGVIGSAMNSIPTWVGDNLGNPGMVTYNVLEEAYQDACIGNDEPDLMTANKAAYAFMKERIQTQQRFAQEKDPIWGVTSFRFNNAMVQKDDYFPSLKYGKNDAILGNYLTKNFTSSAAPASQSNLPATTTIQPNEVIGMFNTKHWLYRVSNDPEYGGGFTGFKPAQDNTRVAGQVLLDSTLEATSCRTQKQLYGINA
jgi:hypothetical protein